MTDDPMLDLTRRLFGRDEPDTRPAATQDGPDPELDPDDAMRAFVTALFHQAQNQR